jgi:hypothetical protein
MREKKEKKEHISLEDSVPQKSDSCSIGARANDKAYFSNCVSRLAIIARIALPKLKGR